MAADGARVRCATSCDVSGKGEETGPLILELEKMLPNLVVTIVCSKTHEIDAR